MFELTLSGPQPVQIWVGLGRSGMHFDRQTSISIPALSKMGELAHLVVHPVNEGDIWKDSDPEAAWRAVSHPQPKESHSTCRMHHLVLQLQLSKWLIIARL
jgi:hypothetical protein